MKKENINWSSTSSVKELKYTKPEPKRDRFEYQHDTNGVLNPDHWNDMGNKGWEMVHYGNSIIWKRKIMK